MFKFLLVLCCATAIVTGQTWVSRAGFKKHHEFWLKLMQEMVYEVEAREWCNLKLNDATQTIDLNLFNLYVNGTVQYTNGFVISIQKIDIVEIEQVFTSRTVEGLSVPFGTIQGNINFRNMTVGFDVYANLLSPKGEYRFTGTFLHDLVKIRLELTQNLITKELRSDFMVTSATDSGRMNYMPATNISQALGRRFSHTTFDSAGNWARNIFGPIMLDIVKNKLDFPEVCFNNCT